MNKEEEGEELQGHGDASAARQLVSTRLPSRSYPTGYIPAHSPTSPTSTLRATRAHDADLLIYSLTVPPWRVIKIHRFTGIFQYA